MTNDSLSQLTLIAPTYLGRKSKSFCDRKLLGSSPTAVTILHPIENRYICDCFCEIV
ncbi:hypothetical protein LC605_26515 [Nostoc sp. CHAB 5836]|uniref:hypothetical protein n=1 Tax=Nostoc sp. CHAB 5836 TaxID=2780404 RepID=UPI001E3A95E5|nr:hypothetical protein [Nostoc sp. CHAB 5836]MCC5618577.1 hypothetical protein [Nostoc sp. CHAB 5836]